MNNGNEEKTASSMSIGSETEGSPSQPHRADFTVRMANADDIEDLVDLHRSCLGPDDHLAVLLGDDFLRAVYRWQVVESSQTVTVVAEMGGRIVGLGGACDRSYTGPMIRACLRELLVSLIRFPALLVDARFWNRITGREAGLTKAPKALLKRPGVAHFITGVVDARYRGLGINTMVVETLRGIIQDRGGWAVCVSTLRSSAAARRVLIKLGFEEVPAAEDSTLVYYITYFSSDDGKQVSDN